MAAPTPACGDHPAAFAAWVIAAGSTLVGLTAAFIGPHHHVPWDAAIFPLLFGVPGAVIAGQLHRNPVGWLMLFVGACFAANTVAVQYLAAGAGSGAEWWAWWVGRGGGASLTGGTSVLSATFSALLGAGGYGGHRCTPGPHWAIALFA